MAKLTTNINLQDGPAEWEMGFYVDEEGDLLLVARDNTDNYALKLMYLIEDDECYINRISADLDCSKYKKVNTVGITVT